MIKDSSIDYDVVGEGYPLLLISGLGFGRWSWFKQVPALSGRFRTISFDLRSAGRLDTGHGAYSVANLTAHAAALLERLEIERAHVVGTSLGGFVAQELALSRPDLVDRLVLISTSYGVRRASRCPQRRWAECWAGERRTPRTPFGGASK